MLNVEHLFPVAHPIPRFLVVYFSAGSTEPLRRVDFPSLEALELEPAGESNVALDRATNRIVYWWECTRRVRTWLEPSTNTPCALRSDEGAACGRRPASFPAAMPKGAA
jgi:hypothetical protein